MPRVLRLIPAGYHAVEQARPASQHYCTKHQTFWVNCLQSCEEHGDEYWPVHCPVILIERDARPGPDKREEPGRIAG